MFSATGLVHPASLVDPSVHNPALLGLVKVKLSKPLIDYLVDCVSDTVDYAMGRPSSSSRRRNKPELAKFTTFATNVLTRAEVTTPVVLASLVYIDRAKPHLHIALEEWALERVFLGALIVASKYTNDSTLKNVHWALCTGVFGKRDIGRIEREFLDVLDWELGMTESDLLSHHASIYAAISAASPSSSPLSTSPHSSHRFSPVVRRARNHRRSAVVPVVPELDPSSPESSDGSSSLSSSSPQTPSPTEGFAVRTKQPPHKPTEVSASTFGTILKSFPLPHSHSQHSMLGTHQYPIHVDA